MEIDFKKPNFFLHFNLLFSAAHVFVYTNTKGAENTQLMIEDSNFKDILRPV